MHPQFPSVTECLPHPAVEVTEPNLAVGDLEDVGAREKRLQDLVAVAEHVRRQGVRQQGGLVCLLKVRVAVEVERVAQSGEHVDDLIEGQLVEVGHRHRTRQRQVVHMAGHIGRVELGVAAASADGHQVVGDDLAAQKERHGVCAVHDSNAFMKSTASLWTS